MVKRANNLAPIQKPKQRYKETLPSEPELPSIIYKTPVQGL